MSITNNASKDNYHRVAEANLVLGMTCLHKGLLPYGWHTLSDGTSWRSQKANWVLGMTCLHRGLLSYGWHTLSDGTPWRSQKPTTNKQRHKGIYHQVAEANWVLGMTTYIRDYSPMDDIPSVTALHDGARRPIGSWEWLAYISDYSLVDDIPSVTALHDGAKH
jgi:hypothetical protein